VFSLQNAQINQYHCCATALIKEILISNKLLQSTNNITNCGDYTSSSGAHGFQEDLSK